MEKEKEIIVKLIKENEETLHLESNAADEREVLFLLIVAVVDIAKKYKLSEEKLNDLMSDLWK